MTRVLAQADDFSGAAEVGHCFAVRNLRTRVLLDARFVQRAGSTAVQVVDTHSRTLDPAAAATVLNELLTAHLPDVDIFFKKIDSLWRGNIAAELQALQDQGCHVVVAGALPPLHRSVRNGVPLIGGIPLHRTDLWAGEAVAPPRLLSDLFAPMRRESASAPTLVYLNEVRSADFPSLLRQRLIGKSPRVLILDGESAGDLAAVVSAVSRLGFTAAGRRIALAGTGGLAQALAAAVATAPDTGHRAVLPAGSVPAPVLVVVGSASAAARHQVTALLGSGVSEVRIRPAAADSDILPAQALHSISTLLGAGKSVVLTIDDGGVLVPAASRGIVRCLARLVGDALAAVEGHPHLILTGGETAREVLDQLRIVALTPLHAVEHGAVISICDDGRLVATKPGSFGDEHVLAQLYRAVTAAAAGTQSFISPNRGKRSSNEYD